MNKNIKTEVKILFEDFENQLSFMSCQSEIRKFQQKQEFIRQASSDDNEGNVKAILAIPIISSDQLIGAITFDFIELPLKYRNDMEKMKNIVVNKDLEDLNDLEIQRWFQIAESCREIIQPMLGSEINLKYKNLFEEEWKE